MTGSFFEGMHFVGSVNGFRQVAGFCYPYWPIQVTNNQNLGSRAHQRTGINYVTCAPTILIASMRCQIPMHSLDFAGH